MNKELELRMYFFVPYQLTGIQQAIQAGHASLEYARKFGDTKLFKDFVDNYKTWIILNGGTTNNSIDNPGTLNEYIREIDDYNNNHDDKIKMSLFSEPDLNFALTAVCFIADERVFNYEDYPEFLDYLIKIGKIGRYMKEEMSAFKKMDIEERKEKYSTEYAAWEEILGGEKNVFLRNLLKGKKLA